MDDLPGRVAVVTGAASGIGLGIAEAFAREGMRLVLADVDAGRLEQAAELLRASGTEVEAVVTDVGDAAAVDALADATLARFGGVHVVCNNAGTIRPGLTWELPLADWELVLRVNLLGVVHGRPQFRPAPAPVRGGGPRGERGVDGRGRSRPRNRSVQRLQARRPGVE